MKSGILAIVIRATSRILTATPHTETSTGMVWKSSSWIICARDSAQAGAMSVLLTEPSCLLAADVWEQDPHQYHNLTPCSTRKTTQELPSKSMWPLHICKIWQTRVAKYIHLPWPSQVLLKKSLFVSHTMICQQLLPEASQPALQSFFAAQAL